MMLKLILSMCSLSSFQQQDADLAANSGVVQVNGKAEADDKAQTPKAQRIDWLEYLLIALVVAVVAMAISYVY